MTHEKWAIDPSHSEIQFKIKHLMISTVTGHFRKFHLEASTDDYDFTKVRDFSFTINTDSIDTNNEQRDEHLKSEDFFKSEIYPHITFDGMSFEGTDLSGKLSGNLTIRNVTKPITFGIEFGGIVQDMYDQTKAGFTIEGKLNRKDFGLTWDAMTEAGRIILGDEIKFSGEIQLIKQVEETIFNQTKSFDLLSSTSSVLASV
jgi:polyisoprenoid-binding protein YceI